MSQENPYVEMTLGQLKEVRWKELDSDKFRLFKQAVVRLACGGNDDAAWFAKEIDDWEDAEHEYATLKAVAEGLAL